MPLVEHQRQLLHALRDRHRLDRDVVALGDLGPREHPVVRLGQAKQGHRRQPRVHRRHVDVGAAGEHVAPRDRQRVELRRRALEALVLDEPADQRLARVLALLVLAGRLLLARRRRQQLAALEPRQRRRHHQVVARDLEVQRSHEVEVLEVLLGHERDRDVEDVELVPAHQVQQQVERPLEQLERDGVDRRPPLAREALACLRHRDLDL